MAEVASSRMRMLGRLMIERAIARHWRSPPEFDTPDLMLVGSYKYSGFQFHKGIVYLRQSPDKLISKSLFTRTYH